MWTSEKFSSLEDKLRIKIKGFCPGGTLELLSVTKNGEEKIIYQADLSGSFIIMHETDPVSLAVYEKAVSFYARITSACRIDEFSTSFTPDEQSTDDEKECLSFASKNTAPVVREDGSEVQVPINPKKVLFMGNSILVGMFSTYGMCATDRYNDYAYHVSQAILERSPDCVF